MPAPGISETETVVKRVLPYLQRRGYDVEGDLVFELPTTSGVRQKFVDICVMAGSTKPKFVIEAKRQSHRLTEADRKQALEYGHSVSVPFVVVTNGVDLELLNTATGEPLQVTSSRAGKAIIPHKSQLAGVLKKLRDNPNSSDLRQTDDALPFRPGVPLKQLNGLFARCHSKIRTLEKDEDSAFADFSKLLFLRLLEEKADDPDAGFNLPYSTRFHELAERPPASYDEVKTLVNNMIDECRKQYGDVITSGLNIRKSSTYAYLVQQLSKVSFTDSGLDTKGAAFEYFVRATLKGKKLGQYFTPRPLVDVMLELIGRDLIVETLASGNEIKVLDPACGTGGFLVFLMKQALENVESRHKSRRITTAAAQDLSMRLMEKTFYGIDANPGVASSAKMNMIISGDGHTNISCGNSLTADIDTWSLERPEYDVVISNPPFGTSEASLPADDLAEYPVKTTKGQLLFLQKMVRATKLGGFVCTVIDDGALNTPTASAVRRWLLDEARVLAVISLPSSTFRPNKITVKSSVLLLQRFDPSVEDPEEDYPITYAALDSLGYHPSGELIRGFSFAELRDELRELMAGPLADAVTGKHWRAFPLSSHEVRGNAAARLDYKFWDAAVRAKIEDLTSRGGRTIKDLNTIGTKRGKSPAPTLYVDKEDGYAAVLKAGSSVTAFGAVTDSGDWIEKSAFDEMPDSCKVQKLDVLLSSTGDGTLGKAAVYEDDAPAVADSHVTLIRVDAKEIDPWFLADYLREGFGRVQSNRLFTGSTGLIELNVEDVDVIVVPTFMTLAAQRKASKVLRKAESEAQKTRAVVDGALHNARAAFAGFDLDHDGEVMPL
jgi:type I restriction enzyme M protein